jgi:hypothetical protein
MNNIGGGKMPAAMSIGEEEMPIAMNMGDEVMPAAMNNNLEVLDVGFAWAEVPEYGETTGGPPMVDEE